jgi:hypothetical protein
VTIRDVFATGYTRTTHRHGVGVSERALATLDLLEASPQPTPTLKLGELEGIWAVIYARREAVERLHGQALQDVLDAIARLDWGTVLDAVGTQLLIDPALSGRRLARALGGAVENLIRDGLPAADRAAWQTAMTAALTDATAQGQTAGLALIGQAGSITIDWDLAATDAKAALAGNQLLATDATGWIGQQTHGIGWQVAQRLAALWDQGATRDDMEQAITDLLDTSTSTAGVLLDSAIGQAISRGALTTYSQAGVEYADFVTAGDARVCAACGEAEDNNPYLLYNCPQPGLHVGCRCTVSPSDYQPTGAALSLLTAYAVDDMEAA